MKLIVDFAIIFLGLERPGRIGVMYLEIKASIFGGVTLPRNILGKCVQRQKSCPYIHILCPFFYNHMQGD
jgi:ABC-type lipopolysaccharide export system ATPase subunit